MFQIGYYFWLSIAATPVWVIIFHLDYCCSHLIDLHLYSGPYIIHSSLTSKVIFFVNIIRNLNKTFHQFPIVLGMFSQLITKAHRPFCMTLLPTSLSDLICFLFHLISMFTSCTGIFLFLEYDENLNAERICSSYNGNDLSFEYWFCILRAE